MDHSFPRFHFNEPIRRPVLTAEPSVCTRVLKPTDQFLIFASDGLWEHFTNEEAVELVHNSPRMVSTHPAFLALITSYFVALICSTLTQSFRASQNDLSKRH